MQLIFRMRQKLCLCGAYGMMRNWKWHNPAETVANQNSSFRNDVRARIDALEWSQIKRSGRLSAPMCVVLKPCFGIGANGPVKSDVAGIMKAGRTYVTCSKGCEFVICRQIRNPTAVYSNKRRRRTRLKR